MVADMDVDMVADMEVGMVVDMVVDMEVDKVADMVADISGPILTKPKSSSPWAENSNSDIIEGGDCNFQIS